MIRAVADSHAVIWYIFKDSRLSPAAKAMIDGAAAVGEQIAISSISLVEIVYLMEKGRIHPTTLDEVIRLVDMDQLLSEIPVDRSIVLALQTIDRKEIPEMPDRIIAATAVHLGVPLISRDRKIQASGVATIW